MKLSEREKTLLFILGLVAIAVIGINFILLPSLESYKVVQVGRNEAINRQIEVQGLLQKAATIDQDLGVAGERMRQVIRPFFQELDKEYIDRWLHNIAETTEVEITSLNMSEAIVQNPNVYNIEDNKTTYPIKDYYQTITHDEQEIKTEKEQIFTEALQQDDSVLQVVIDMQVLGNNGDILKLIDKINKTQVNVVINSFELQEKDTRINLTLYMIDKEKESNLEYQFKTPSGKVVVIE